MKTLGFSFPHGLYQIGQFLEAEQGTQLLLQVPSPPLFLPTEGRREGR